jgi:hypothetical protein
MSGSYVVGWVIPTGHIVVKGSGYPCIGSPVYVTLQLLNAIIVLSYTLELRRLLSVCTPFFCAVCYFVCWESLTFCFVFGQGMDLFGSRD